jgi:hypothetical protein
MPDHAGHEISGLKVAEISSRKGGKGSDQGDSEGTRHARDQRLA